MSVSVLQITDTHLLRRPGDRLIGVDTQESLMAVLSAALDGARPDILLVTGDIAHDPAPATYDRFLHLVSDVYDGPVLGVPGNHDIGTAMPAAIRGERVASLDGWHIVPLDTHVDDAPGGHVSDTALALLQDTVAALTGWVLIAGHHPPIGVDAPWLDKDRIDNYRALLNWVGETDRIRGWVFGHLHQEVDQRTQGCRLLGSPSTCFQFAPGSESFSIDTRPPGYRWLVLGDDGGLETRVTRVHDYSITVDLSQRS